MAVRLGGKLVRILNYGINADKQIVLPRYEKFLRDNREIVYSQKVIDQITDGLKQVQTSRAGRLGGSSAGHCLRQQVLGYLGAPGTKVDLDLQKIFEDGKWRHMRLQAALLQAGIIDRIEVPIKWKKMRAEGSVDGAGIVPDDHPNEAWRGLEFGLEIKGAMSFAFANIEKLGPQKYLDQVARYFLYTGFDLFVIIVESKDTQQTLEFVVEEKDVDLTRAVAELRKINDHIDLRQLPPKLDLCALARGPNFHSCAFGGSVSNSCHQHDEKW